MVKLVQYKKYLIKAGLITAYVCIHIYLLRPVRTAIFEYQVHDKIFHAVQENKQMACQKLDTRLVVFKYNHDQSEKLFYYKVPFGSWFFIGMVGLILIGADKKYFAILIAAHALILLSSAIIFSMQVTSSIHLLHLLDFLSTYLAPLSALGVIPLSYYNKREDQSSDM